MVEPEKMSWGCQHDFRPQDVLPTCLLLVLVLLLLLIVYLPPSSILAYDVSPRLEP